MNRWNGQMPYALGRGAVPFFLLPVSTRASEPTIITMLHMGNAGNCLVVHRQQSTK